MGGKLFNSILIDKFTTYIDEHLISYNENFNIEKLNSVLLSHYPSNAFHIHTSRRKLRLEFTPTRYKVNNEHSDTNIIMIPENTLYELFKELGFYSISEEMYDSFVISKLHLTKNICTKLAVPNYIKMFSKRTYKNGLKPLEFSSNSTNKSLVLSTLKKNITDNDIVGNKKILFYDKVQDLKDKANLRELFLREELDVEDIQQIPITAYNKSNKYLNLHNLHILRCELQYAESTKLRKISDFITNKKDSKNLKLSTLLNLLMQGNLYSTLDKFYTYELKNSVFFNTPIEKQVKLNKYELLLLELTKNKSAIKLLNLYQDKQKQSLRNVLNKLQKIDNNKLYKELYSKFNKAENPDLLIPKIMNQIRGSHTTKRL